MDLREALREGTREAHDALDARMSALDLSCASGLGTFLRTTHSGMAALRGAGPAEPLLGEMRAALEDDLRHLGLAAPAPERCEAQHPVAGAYLVLGSRLGAGALARRWPGAPARSYLTLPGRGPEWRALCDELRARPGAGAEADEIVGAARALFGAFGRAAAREMDGRLRDRVA